MSLEKKTFSAPITWEISSVVDIVDYVYKNCKDRLVLFRGQSEDWPLLPKIARTEFINTLLEDEDEMFSNFKKEAVMLIENEPQTNWDWLSIAQHHGLATRLLDWTRNPLAALWFAVEDMTKDNKRPGVVWVFWPNESEDIINPYEDNNEIGPFDIKQTKVFLPNHVVPRIRAQQGVFSIHNLNIDPNLIAPLEKEYANKLHKIEIPSSSFPLIREQLDRCGVHAASLIPDLDGLSRRLTWLYTVDIEKKLSG